ncbi:polyketide beta-ketoacyl:ACP synthase, PedM homolog [Candidatus Profftella armatura (Diaphorina cf. continua)]|uniref:Polyketide beta-ketoacyl:ACP synthase, PedM homolog n=1 Tax=Candidatus Profftella armatura (Diaphorina cf. continua) TaxID=2661583 RepID=A0A7R6VZM3_9PROT|nr:beta-ketoacyl synthase N-terminal-like domain-containing protein [Candidatus Profftella armatura (Diaphorina cf. continua)]BCG49541.1 polyketide beta-ketoacyl:ACP synthase, PedM homolog [Candidatus Profftella armatura (Diaphorina cf. continua)]
MIEKSNIYISGMGIISAIGSDVSSFSNSLIKGKSGIDYEINNTSSNFSKNIIAKINNFNLENSLKKITDLSKKKKEFILHISKRSPFFIQTSIIAALQAWYHSKLHKKKYKILPERIGLIIAGHNTTQNYQYSLYPEFLKKPEYLSPRYAIQFMDSNQIGILSEIFNIRGEGFITGGASASGNIGIIHGMRLIQNDIVDACLIISAMTDLSPMEIQAFRVIGAMGGKKFYNFPKKTCRPFDKLAEGFIYGQASAALLLEGNKNIKNYNKPYLARLLGGAINLHATASAEPDLKNEINVMNSALKQSGLKKNMIDYLNTHGSSSPLGDKIEISAIKKVYKNHFTKLWLNSTKSLTGHCLYSAGIVEIIASIIQMKKKFIHPNLNLEFPINNQAKFSGKKSIPININNIMSNSFGFSGINSSIILCKK